MKDWREILKLERKTAQPGDPFAPPRRCNLCNYYQGRYYELHPSAEPECIQHAKALAYALAHLPLTFHPEQDFSAERKLSAPMNFLRKSRRRCMTAPCGIFRNTESVISESVGRIRFLITTG